jgi:hypothetical protein
MASAEHLLSDIVKYVLLNKRAVAYRFNPTFVAETVFVPRFAADSCAPVLWNTDLEISNYRNIGFWNVLTQTDCNL